MNKNPFDTTISEGFSHKAPTALSAVFVSTFFHLTAKASRISVWFKGVDGSPRFGRIGRILNGHFYLNTLPEPVKVFRADESALNTFDDTLTRLILSSAEYQNRALEIITGTIQAPTATKEAKENANGFLAYLKTAFDSAAKKNAKKN